MIMNSSSPPHFLEQNLIFKIGEQWFALPIAHVKDVIYTPTLTPIPLASKEVAGLINLRGHIVTAIYTNEFLEMEAQPTEHTQSIVLQDPASADMYSFIVDKVFDIESFSPEDFESTPPNLKDTFGALMSGVFQDKERLIIILDPHKIMEKVTTAS